ncbi:MAG: hypothetical protein R3E73_01135 [Porticoccaceae bacterium]
MTRQSNKSHYSVGSALIVRGHFVPVPASAMLSGGVVFGGAVFGDIISGYSKVVPLHAALR